MADGNKSKLEIVLMPIVIALIGVIATASISIVQLSSAEKQAEATRASAERMALAEQQLKILDLIKDKIFSNSEKDKKLAVQLVNGRDVGGADR